MMQLMRSADVPLDRRDRVFHYSGFRAVTGAMILVAIALGALVFGWLKNAWIAYYVAAVVAICLLIFQRLVTARFRSSNWLIRLTDHGLFVKFRSYLNHHFSDQDFTVVFLPYSEIRSVKLVKERQELPDRDDTNQSTTIIRTRRIIDLELSDDSTQLAEALAKERERVFAKPTQGTGRTSSRYQHFPVRLPSPTLLRIEWGVVPDPQTFLDGLTRHTLVRDTEETSRDFVNFDGLSREEQETRLLELAESGDMIGAVGMARKLYSYDLAAAKHFVEDLARKRSQK
ncbi:MAG: hypothetical protein E6J74_39725 [Deltaproteobacteria bacterium]|nr:MAG: hypothetical protein E6J74_39725 [Deltaproteobacteria bacterium]